MTKARDIASAAPAPSTVSATEIGYLDGVTSAIQTQIDGKASTTADIPKSLIDAKGDLIVGSAADTAARLAVGTNNHVLTADSSATNGVKWAAPAAAGFVGCYLKKSADQTISNATDTILTWDQEEFDTDGFHDNSVNNSRITIPTGKSGYYAISGGIRFDINATGRRIFGITVNTGGVIDGTFELPSNTGVAPTVVGYQIRYLNAGDYVRASVYQSSGGNLTVFSTTNGLTFFQIQYLGA